MTIAIITFSRAKNYGGVLQAYALYQYLSEMGHDPFFIDYIPERSNIYNTDLFVKRTTDKSKLWGKNEFTRFVWKKLYFEKIKKDYLMFSTFIQKECSSSDRYFSNEELMRHPPQADIFVVGSDQVWNSDYAPGKQLELPFYLPFTTGEKISYASSFGNASIPETQKEEVVELLRSFKALSVREETGKQILEGLGLKATVVADPTLLFDGKFWAQKCIFQNMSDPYILLYQVKFDIRTYKVAKELSKKLKCRLIVLSMNRVDTRKCPQKVIMAPTVEEWLSYIKNAYLVYTDSFHASVFSILFHTPFVVNSASRKNMATRISNLLNLAGLENLEMLDFNIEEGLQKATEKVDWDKVDARIQKIRTFSIQWLREAIAEPPNEGKLYACDEKS